MITESTIYWILKLSEIRTLFIIFAIIAGIFTIISGAVWLFNFDSWNDNDLRMAQSGKRTFYCSIIIAFLLAIPAVLFPTTKQMAMIKVIPMIANSEIVGEMSADAKEFYKMGINAIKEQLTGDKKEQSK